MTTISEVREIFLEQRAQIDMLDQELASERRSIQISAFQNGREMNDDEKKRLKEIGAIRQELAEALRSLSLSTLEQINGEEIKSLERELVQVNEMLKDDLDNLKVMEDYAEKASKVANGLSKVIEKVADLAA